MKLKKLVNNAWVLLVLTLACTCLFAPPAKAEDPPQYVLQFGNQGPDSIRTYNPVGLATDANGNVYVADPIGIKKFSAQGMFLDSWAAARGVLDLHFVIGAQGVAIDDKGFLYVCINDGTVVKTTLSAVYVNEWIVPNGDDPNDPANLWGIAVDNNGHVYVSDVNHSTVVKFKDDGTYLSTLDLSSVGAGAGGLACDADGNIYITDGSNGNVMKYSPTGAFITEWGTTDNGLMQLVSPAAIAWSNGAVYVCGGVNYCQKYTDSGEYLLEWGGNGTGDGQFGVIEPGIAVAGDGSIYVSDLNNHRIQRFMQNPNPVTLSTFSAHREGSQVALRWEVNSLLAANVGFKVYRGDVDITQRPLQGKRRYEFIDAQAPREAVTYWLQEVDADGDSYRHGPINVQAADALTLDVAVRPNPFNPTTTIAFTVPDRLPVTLAIYDATGKLVTTLIDHAAMEVGSYSIPYAHTGASGVYFARLTVGKKSQTQKLVCLK